MVLIRGLNKIHYISDKLNRVSNSPILNNHMIYRIKEHVMLTAKIIININIGHLIKKHKNKTKTSYLAQE